MRSGGEFGVLPLSLSQRAGGLMPSRLVGPDSASRPPHLPVDSRARAVDFLHDRFHALLRALCTLNTAPNELHASSFIDRRAADSTGDKHVY